MSHDIALETVAPRYVAGLEFSTSIATLSADMTMATRTLLNLLADSGVAAIGPVIAVYSNKMRAERPWDCEVCVPIAEGAGGHPELMMHKLRGGLMATVMHKGSYGELRNTHARSAEWFAEHGHTYGGPPREIYLNSPGDVAEDDLLTRIEFPVILAKK